MAFEAEQSVVLTSESEILFHILGRSQSEADWLKTLSVRWERLVSNLLPDSWRIEGQGFSLGLVELDDGLSSEAETCWGLQSCTLLACPDERGSSPWLHSWPLGLQIQDLSKTTVLQTLGEPLVSTKAFALFECELAQTAEVQAAPRKVGVQCEWGQDRLLRLTMHKLGLFEPLQPFEFAEAATAPVVSLAPAQHSQPEPEITCRSEERTPKTGLYEAHVLRSHPNAHYYNTSRNRFYFSQEGKPMIRLGVPEGGESLVVWTWRSASM